ncbi:GNAT family N-acetyltransferase [Polluticaenibacter yanchengensis]|uniref:GNAT family protein n=1 Tax=Polluticaenibacter yanchengensis TaxID=3014562 RepID=A0ABT4UNU4_9BACT|nr:GNAT family protein [Chitinophagaceae bacterium LY-5]
MKWTIDENIEMEITAEKFAVPLFDVIDSNREHLSEFLSWVGNMQSVENLRKYLKNCEQLYNDKTEISFVILFNKKPVGRIGLHFLNFYNRSGAIGYWLDKHAVGKGIITKCCRRLIDYGFNELSLNRIEIKAAVNNYRSQAIPVRLNFKKEGILREAEWLNDGFADLCIYSLLKKEWVKTNATS